MNKIPLLALVGPTGIGKSQLAQALALRLNSVIIHADSRQVYKEMEIGTAKPSRAMREKVPHHLLDVAAPDEDFNAGKYKALASSAIEASWQKTHTIPIVEGGTGLYIRALIDGIFNGPPADTGIRRRLKELAARRGVPYLHRQLEKVDPNSAAKLHPNDISRIVRALEVFELTGSPISALQQNIPPSPYEPIFFGLDAERGLLYKWIEARCDKMMAEGLLRETEQLLQQGYHVGLNSMQSLGYKEMTGHIMGEYSLEEAVCLLKRNTRRYAKRQLTWFKRDTRVQWLEVTHPHQTDELIPQILNNIDSNSHPVHIF